MSTVINAQVVIENVRNVEFSLILEAVQDNMGFDENDMKIISEMFEIQMSNFMKAHAANVHSYTDIQFRYVQCELLVRIVKKYKLLMYSIEEYCCHDAEVDAAFQYDEAHQHTWEMVQSWLNTTSAKKSINQQMVI